MSSLRSVRCSRRRPSRRWRSGCMMARRSALRWCNCRGLPKFRCRLRNAGCGSSIVWKDRARPTRSRSRYGSRASWTSRRSSLHSATLSSATKACGRSSPRRWACRARRYSTLDAARPRLAVEINERVEACRLAFAAAARRVFDLAAETAAPRAPLFSLAEGEHVLLLLVHHIAVCDGWSLALGAVARPRGRVCGALATDAHRNCCCFTRAICRLHAVAAWPALGEESDAGSLIARQLSFWAADLDGLPDQIELPK